MVPRPNILWILTTQWRAQATGYAGDPNVRTPQLDALAARSVNYTQAVTPHPFGPFARAALLTGLPAPANGVATYFDPLPVEQRTIAHELREIGYATAFFGKWHLGVRDPAAPLVGEEHARTMVPPERRGGFEFWEGFESGFLLNDPWLHGTRLPVPEQFRGYQSDVLCQRAGSWVKRSGPWFAVVSFEAPHPPYDAPAAGCQPGDPEAITLARNVPAAAASRARRELSGYYAHIEATDRAVGGLLAVIDFERTVVVFTSVHGDMHGAHGLFRKGWPHEESVRVPLLIAEPGRAARRDDSCPSLIDLPARTLQWAGAAGTAVDLAPSAARISMPSVVALPHQCDRPWSGVRTRRRKLVLNPDGTPWLFFDLEEDPFEQVNLAEDPARAGERAALARLI
ncbi:MAG: sulfatase-like hydrolase/transferase [Verrucomicrobia bacterium]|nr:sulfatase-like hydrolase/transferase [Verrucomicrobiota bacterium]